MKKSSINRFAAILCSALLPLSANAAIVTLQSNWAGPVHLGNSGVFTFTYDDTVADSNPDPLRGTYQNAIISGSFLLNGTTTYTLAAEQPNSIIMKAHSLSGGGGPATTFIYAQLKNSGGVILRNESPEVTSDLLSLLPTIKRSEASLEIGGVLLFSTGNPYMFTTVSSVPVPAGAWLFGSALLALGGAARRARTTR